MKKILLTLLFIVLLHSIACAALSDWILGGERQGSGGSGTPGGSDTQVQFNDGGSFGGDAGLTYNKTTDALAIAGNATIGDGLTVSGRIDSLSGILLPNERITSYDSDGSNLMSLAFFGLNDYTQDNVNNGVNGNFIYSNLTGDYSWGVHTNIDTTADSAVALPVGLHGTNNVGLMIATDDTNNTNTPIEVYQWGTNGNTSQDIIDINVAYDWRSGGSASGSFTGDLLDYTNYDIKRLRIDNLGQIYFYDVDADDTNYGLLKCADDSVYLQSVAGNVILQPKSGGSNYTISHSDSTGIVPLNDSAQSLGVSGFEWATTYTNNIRSDTGEVYFGDEDIVTTGDLTCNNIVAGTGAALVDGIDIWAPAKNDPTAQDESIHLYFDDDQWANGATALGFMISRDVTTSGAVSGSAFIGTYGKAGFTADSTIETVTFGANDFVVEDDGTLTSSAIAAGKYIVWYMETDSTGDYSCQIRLRKDA